MVSEPDSAADAAAPFFAEIPAPVALFDREGRYLAASAAWVEAFGLPRTQFAGCRHDELSVVGAAALEYVQRCALGGESISDCPIADRNWVHKSSRGLLSARPRRDAQGVVSGLVAALRMAENRPDVLGTARRVTDPLTGLAERPQFIRRVQEALAAPAVDQRSVVLVAVNIENLRSLNSLYGFAAGDQVLKITAERLVSGTRSRLAVSSGEPARRRDMAARLAAGQFGILFGPPALAPENAQAVADRLLAAVEAPIGIAHEILRPRASVGFVVAGRGHRGADDAMRDLDLALQRARALGPGKAVAWEPALTMAARQRYSLAEQLRRAFDNGEFLVQYQPVLRLRDGRMVGAEALLRWNHPGDGLIASAGFLPMLEETGLVSAVGCWALREVIRQAETWHLLYGREIVDWVGVKLSPRQVRDPALLLAALREARAAGFAVHRLKPAIPAAILAGEPEAARSLSRALSALGMRAAIDDFGAGHVPAVDLDGLAVDSIKIDRAAAAQAGSAEGEKLVTALLALVRKSGAGIIATGVETAAQRDFLRDSGCEFGQGHVLAEPMGGAAFGAYALSRTVAADPAVSRTSRSRSPAA